MERRTAAELSSIRLAIRQHRDQIGDYRCWVDDEVLYHRVLPELRGVVPEVPPGEEFLRRCETYYKQRQNPEESPVEIPLDSSLEPLNLVYDNSLDSDLNGLDAKAVQLRIDQLLQAVRDHQAKGYSNRTYRHDCDLYLCLPEKKLPITQLPPRELFLGRGCPAYNDYCQLNPGGFAKGLWAEDDI